MKSDRLVVLCSVCLSLIIVSLGSAEINLDDFAGVFGSLMKGKDRLLKISPKMETMGNLTDRNG